MSVSDPCGGVLCAGFGTRLEPLTETVPKPLLPFLNTPFLTYALDHFAGAGIQRVGMNLHHLAEAVPPVADRLCREFGLDPHYAREWEIMGTAGGIRGIWRALDEPEAPLVVTNGDSVMNLDLGAHLERHRNTEATVTLLVRPRADDQPGNVWLDRDSNGLIRIRDFEAPRTSVELEEFDFTGVQILDPSVLRRIPLEPGDVIEEVYGPMLERGESIAASVQRDFWAALDNPNLLMSTTRRVLEDPDVFDQAPLDRELRDGVYTAGTEPFDADGVEFDPPVFLGEEVELAENVRVGPYAVLDGVSIGEGVEIEEAIVYGVGELEESLSRSVAVADRVAPL